MKPTLITFSVILVFMENYSYAENSIGISGNYYKERSTRVIEPLLQVRQELPHNTELDVTYLVDQITSASGAFTNTDVAFSEYRNEIRVGGKSKFLGFLTPGISLRYSHEPDYTSMGLGLNLAIELFKKSTTLSTFFQMVSDDITSKYDPNYTEELSTMALGISIAQILDRTLITGLSAEVQVDRGYQENQYRVETHPRCRDRYSFTPWVRYRIPQSKTTLRTSYRYYQDSWNIVGHSVNFEANQQVTTGLEIVPRIRYHTQNGTFFEISDNGTTSTNHPEIRSCHLENEQLRGGAQQPLVRFSTNDPKLTTFDALTYGVKLRWQQRWLKDTALGIFSDSWIEPAYYYFDQQNRYGAAHIAQLNFYWPY